jgi:putative Mg2+ transporter-C (MgtC) family protein
VAAAQRPEGDRAGADDTPLNGELDLAFRVFVALIIGLVLGFERELRGEPAGLRTTGLVAAGACLFTGVGALVVGAKADPTRIASGIVTGIGFLGAGSILRQGEEIKGLTTAASIWIAAAIGMAVGFGYYTTAIVSSVLVLITLVGLRWVESRFFPSKRTRRKEDSEKQL